MCPINTIAYCAMLMALLFRFSDRNLNKTTMADISSPTLEELPKVEKDLKSELENFKQDAMKKTETVEKIVLPSSEGKHMIRNMY